MATEQDIYIPKPKVATTSHDVMASIEKRWSPYRFDTKSVEPALIEQCFEAARWAASSYNDQPYFYIVAFREQKASFDKMLGCLIEANQAWAKFASVLILSVSSDNFAKNGKPNRVSQHDLGAASTHFVLQATKLGLSAHQMGGIEAEKIRSTYNVPVGFTPQTAMAIGYASEETLDGQQDLVERDAAVRTRRAISQFVFAESWEQSWKK